MEHRLLDTLLLTCALFTISYGVPVPESMFPAIRDGGIPILQTTIDSLQAKFDAALAAFQPINATCGSVINMKIEQCDQCIIDKCNARVESAACKFSGKPGGWEEIGMNLLTKELIASALGIPGLGLLSEIVDLEKVAKRIGKELGREGEKIGKEVGRIGESTIKEIGRSGEKIGKEVGRFGEKLNKEIGRGAEKIGKEIGRGAERIGKEVGRSGKKVIKELNRWGKKIFGKRAVERRSSEPSCDAINKNAASVCMYYKDSCSQCKFDKNTACPGYTAALDNLIRANNDRAWLEKIKDTKYTIISIDYNPMNFDPTTQGFKGNLVKVNIFGNVFTLSIDMNPFDAVKAGPAIAKQAIVMMKA